MRWLLYKVGKILKTSSEDKNIKKIVREGALYKVALPIPPLVDMTLS